MGLDRGQFQDNLKSSELLVSQKDMTNGCYLSNKNLFMELVIIMISV